MNTHPGVCTINFLRPNATVFVTVSHFHHSLILAGKTGAYQSGAPLHSNGRNLAGKPCPQILDKDESD